MASKSNPPLDGIGDEYQVVSFRLSWGAASLVFFLLTLPARYLLNLQPWRPRNYWIWPLMPPVAIAALSFLGLVAGLLGLRAAGGTGVAKMGVLLNAVVLGIVLLIVAGMTVVLRFR